MRTIKLTNSDKFILIDDEDYDKVNFYNWQINNDKTITSHYRGKTITIASLIYPTPPGIIADHKDRNTLNNQKSNFRYCTHRQNTQNKSKSCVGNCTSKFKGVCYRNDTKIWRARITVNCKIINLGQFKTQEEAALEYNKAAEKYFGEFAALNIL